MVKSCHVLASASLRERCGDSDRARFASAFNPRNENRDEFANRLRNRKKRRDRNGEENDD